MTSAPAGPSRQWIAVAVAGWIVILAAAVLWGVSWPSSTDREETTVAQARPVVDRAAADVVAAVTADGQATAAISGFARVDDCRVTVVRPGQRYQRVVTAWTRSGDEEALLSRVAGRLPASYAATVSAGTAPRLFADAGLFVGVNAVAAGPGVVRFVIDTGACRVAGDLDRVAEPAPTRVQQAPVEAALTALGLRARDWRLFAVACPGGGALTTVAAQSPVSPVGPLEPMLRGLAGGAAIVADADLYAYRAGSVDVTVHRVGGGTDVAATTPCPSR